MIIKLTKSKRNWELPTYISILADMDRVRVALGVPDASKTWESNAPALYHGISETGEYVLARYSRGYNVTNVDSLQSINITDPPTDEDIQRLKRLASPSFASLPRVSVDDEKNSSTQASEPRKLGTEARHPTSAFEGRRDPNAPPDFEDEYQVLQRPPENPLQSHPVGDRDLYPLGKNPPLQPTVPGPFSGEGGMQPRPFGMGSTPFIRRDPPYPGAPEEADVRDPLGQFRPGPPFPPPPGGGGGLSGFGGGFI